MCSAVVQVQYVRAAQAKVSPSTEITHRGKTGRAGQNGLGGNPLWLMRGGYYCCRECVLAARSANWRLTATPFFGGESNKMKSTRRAGRECRVRAHTVVQKTLMKDCDFECERAGRSSEVKGPKKVKWTNQGETRRSQFARASRSRG